MTAVAGAGGSVAAVPVMAYVSAGSNVEPVAHLRMAIARLRECFGPLTLSAVYRSRAEGFVGEDFLNLVLGFATRETPQDIVRKLEELHAAAGRVRGGERFGPLTLDLDLLLYGDQVIASPPVPRRDITEYGFVLGPLAEIAPGLRHPVTGETIASLWQRFDQARHPLHRVALSLS